MARWTITSGGRAVREDARNDDRRSRHGGVKVFADPEAAGDGRTYALIQEERRAARDNEREQATLSRTVEG